MNKWEDIRNLTCVIAVLVWLLVGMHTTTSFGVEPCMCVFCWPTLVCANLTCCCCCDCCCCCGCCCCVCDCDCWVCWIVPVFILEAVGVCERDCRITNFCPAVEAVPLAFLLAPSIIVRPACCPGLGLATTMSHDAQIWNAYTIVHNNVLTRLYKRFSCTVRTLLVCGYCRSCCSCGC